MFASFLRWNIVVIVVVLLSIMLSFITACGSTATTSSTPTATSTPTPEPLSSEAAKQRFTDMGIAIKNKDYGALYSTTSMAYQNSHTQQQMIADIQQMIYAPNSDGTDITDFAIGQITIGSRVSDNATIANGE